MKVLYYISVFLGVFLAVVAMGEILDVDVFRQTGASLGWKGFLIFGGGVLGALLGIAVFLSFRR